MVIGGSFNYTGPANRLNDENIFMLGNLRDGHSRAAIEAQRDLARYALSEVDQIVRDYGRPI